MAIIKNKYKDRTDQQIKTFPNGTIPGDFTKKIVYDNETLVNPTIIRTPKYGDDLDTTEFSKVIADLVYNDTSLNEESEKHNYLYSDGVIKNYQKQFEVYEKNLLQVLETYDVNNIIDKDTFSLKPGKSIRNNFVNESYCNFYFYTNSQRLINLYNFFYKEFIIRDIKTMDNNTELNFKDDYSYVVFNGEIPFTMDVLQEGETFGIVLYFPIEIKNTTPYKPKNYINYLKIGNGALKIGDTFIDIKKDTYVSRSVTSNSSFNQIKIPNINEINFKNNFRTRRDLLLAYYDQNNLINNINFEGIVDLIVGDERINSYSPIDSQILTTPRIKKIDYIAADSCHRIHLDDLCLLKGINSNGQEILFRKINQTFVIRNSINNIFDGEYTIKAINYENRTIDFIHPTFNNNNYSQPIDSQNIIGYFGYLVPNIYALYSVLVYKDDGYSSETQIIKADKIFNYTGLESGVNRIEKTVLEINKDGLFEISKNEIKHLRNFNANLLEYDDAQSLDVPSKKATGVTLSKNVNEDYISKLTEQQLPNEYQEIGFNSLSNSHFIITEDNFSVINNTKISLSEIYLGVKNSLSSIGTEGIKIKLESLEMLYPLDYLRKIENIESINADELRITLSLPDTNIEVDDILFILNNGKGNGDYQTVKIKRIENQKLIINKLNSTSTAEFKFINIFPIYFNIIKKNGVKKICESLLTNQEIKIQVINGLNGKFGDKNGYSRLRFDRFIENIKPNDNLLKNGITESQAKDFKLEINKYYFLSVSGFTIDNIVGTYSSILIEDHNSLNIDHFKKSIYYEINIKSFKGRYPNSLIISDEFGDINTFDITRTFAPFFRVPKYSIMAYDFSNLDVSLRDIPPSEDVVLFDPIVGRFKFHPNVTPSKIYLSYYTVEKLSGASESENFIHKRSEDSNDTMRGKIQDLDNKYIYGASFDSPITVNGIKVNENLNYKGPFRINDNKIELKTNANFVDLDIDKYEIEIDKNSNYEIIDIEKNSLYLKENVKENGSDIQSINRYFLDQLTDQEDKNYYEAPSLDTKEELIFNISEDTTIDKALVGFKKWQYRNRQENNITIPFLINKKFNKVSFYDFNNNLILDCFERTKLENLIINKINLNSVLEDFVYRKLKEKNYRYALNKNYEEDKTFSFKDSDEIKQLNKTLMKDTKHFNKSEMVNLFTENEDNALLKRQIFSYTDLNINKINSDNFINIREHIVNIDLKKINKKYINNIFFADVSLVYNSVLPSSTSILEGFLYFFETSGYNSFLSKQIEVGDFIIKNSNSAYDSTGWDFYRKNDIFNISKLIKNEDLTYSLNDFNDFNIDFDIINFNNCLQKKLVNNILIKNDILKINNNRFLIFYLIKDTNDVYSLYMQQFDINENNFFYPKKIDNENDYLKIATSQITDLYLKINKNNLYYDFMVVDDNTFMICIMSDSFLFKYFYLNDLSQDDGVTFINEKEIKNNPKVFKLNEEIFGIIFNSENILNYDSAVGDLEFKVYDIKTKNNIIFSYQEKTKNFDKVDKIVIDNIKNLSNFNYLKMNDDKIVIFYSNINSFYLNNISFNQENNEYITDYPSGLLNCFKVLSFIKTEDNYSFETSNKKTVYYQNIGQTVFPPKIYPFKINSNIFGINYIQYNLNNIETGNRMYTFNIDGVLQREGFENDDYSSDNIESIKYIYSLNNRQALEFANDKIKIHNFDNDYKELILKEDIDYKTYFSQYNYVTLFKNKLSNGFEIKTITDKNGKVFDKKILTYFTKENNEFKINIGVIEDLEINFLSIESFVINTGNSLLITENNSIFYESEILYFNNKIFLTYLFLAKDNLTMNSIFVRTIEITEKINNADNHFVYQSNIANINYIKIQDDDNKNKFFLNKKSADSIEIYSLRNKTIDDKDKNIISKHTLKITSEDGIAVYEEIRTDDLNNFNYTDETVDLFYETSILNIRNLFKINKNDNIKYILESYKTVNNINSFNYFYIQNDFQFFNILTLNINSFNINYVEYNQENDDLLFFGHINNNIVSYVFDFNTNLLSQETLDQYSEKYNFFKIKDVKSLSYFYYKIINNNLYLKMYLKNDDKKTSLIYENNYTYSSNISDQINFNNYNNIYETFLYLGNSFVRNIWKVFPMNNIKRNEVLLENEIINNKINGNTYKKVFSGSSISATILYGVYSGIANKNIITIFDDSLIKTINNNSLNNLIFYTNNNGNLCVFKILDKIQDSDAYEITYLIGENTKENLYNKRIDYYLYNNNAYSFYKKSYQSLSLKLNMFNYKGVKKNEYEIYRKHNYYYEKNKVFEYNSLYKSDAYIIKGDYKDFQIIYKIDDEYEDTVIYSKKYLIINNGLYSFENKKIILSTEYENTDTVSFVCEKLSNSNIFFSFKKNDDYVYNYILNKNYGFEEIDADYSKRELYKFIDIKNKVLVNNQLTEINILEKKDDYQIKPFAVKRLFNDYVLLLLKIKKDNVTKICHIIYEENGSKISYYNNNYNTLYKMLQSDDIFGYSKPAINSYGYTSLFLYKSDFSKDILQFGIDGEGGVCKLKGILNLF